ncbi:probable 1-acyl-sn-glycerol-3-phosphate acyltransferase 5 [Amaranthus tricolor]|uniref:probable 1-acyl-sn-glycerol-3-phosphate acyltransferase 5 n=1 Tax=Amaranthus tricolor TaxID=29722 RepID=UPI00258C692A|nr:probable 1-acyl-sn-glycerol-3-phosphate acyltransferase 5 [Amaranthus tricolor]XP_057550522.1 probable 1-acyl-sn-glycerol-3-phosphate acyltransferase 5 [Amaranthus tricolor]
MEAKKPPLNDKLEHRTLTPLRFLRGMICLLVLASTAFMMMVYFGFASAFLLRFFSVSYSKKVTSIFFASWLVLWPSLFEKINKTKVVFSGETLPVEKRVLLIANHRTEVDWMYLWNLALRKGCLGYIKYVLKSSLMKLPVFGWAFNLLEFIPVERKWEIDEPIMYQRLSTLKDPQDPIWLAIFPEGTDFTEQKCIRNQKYAADHGLPVLTHVLLPKTKGFFVCMEELRNSLDAVYDVIIGYKPRCPFFLDNVFGVNPSEVHIHIRRLAINDIPNSEEEIGAWLMDTFCLKDKLLREFYSTGHFPNEGTENELSTVYCLVNFIVILILTIICTFLTFFSSFWFKIYVVLVCVILVCATTFNYRPSPIFCLSKRHSKLKNVKQACD